MRTRSGGQVIAQWSLLCLVFGTACGGDAQRGSDEPDFGTGGNGGGASSQGETSSASGGAVGGASVSGVSDATAAGGVDSGGTGGSGGTSGGSANGGSASGGAAAGGAAGAPGDASCDRESLTHGALELITVGPNCTAAGGDTTSVALSGDGRYVAFNSEAADLVDNDTNGNSDAFVFDRKARALEQISVRPDGGPIDGHGFEPRVSDDGRWVSFVGFASNIVMSPTLTEIKLYLRDRDANSTSYLDGDYACGGFQRISSDAKVIVWGGYSDCQSGLGEFDVLLHDRTSGRTQVLGDDEMDNSVPAVSADGKWVAWNTQPPDTGGQFVAELALFEVASGETTTLPVGNAFRFSMTALSDEARVVNFSSNGEFYWYEQASDDLRRISTGIDGEATDAFGYRLDISRDGRYVVFATPASNLVEGDSNGVEDIFLYDAVTEELARVNLALDGAEADDESSYPSISGDGRFIGFASRARNLHPLATQGDWQVYVVDRELL